MRELILSEKYRPKTFDEVVGQDVIIQQLKDFVETPLSLPHILFVSRQPGTGKTTLAYVIKHIIETKDVLILNSSDERKLEVIRERVKNFAMSYRTNTNIPRIVIMDEFDGMRVDSQDALRFIMEQYSSNCKFILTANNETKIIDPIKSRCVVFHLSAPPKDKIMERLKYICEQEQVSYENIALQKLTEVYYPDIRKMINKIQELQSVGITRDFVKTTTEVEDVFYERLKTSSFNEVRKFVIDNEFDIDTLLLRTMQNIIDDNTVNIHKNKLHDVLMYIAELNFRMKFGADKEIQLTSFISKFQGLFL